MASIDFYALESDIRGLIHAILEETDARIFESYSRYDAELREFRSYNELSSAFDLGTDTQGNGHAVCLELWSPTVTEHVEFQRIDLKVPGHSFRYAVRGLGLIQLQFGGEHQGVITDSHYGHWSEAGARQRAAGDANWVDWSALSTLSGRIQRYIRNKTAVAKLRGRPIMPAAFASLQAGSGLKYGPLKFYSDSTEIQRLKAI